MKKNLVLVDFNNLLYRSVFAHQELSHEGEFTGGIYGFISMVSGVVNRYKADRVVVCYDSKPYSRTKFYPEYKADRKQVQEESTLVQLAISRKQIGSFIDRLRMPKAIGAGHEADDFIGEFCEYCHYYKNIFIMSNDSDLYQLLDGRVFLVKTGGLYGIKDFKEEWPEIDPEQWPRCVALKGSHNGVPGIHGVGDKIAYTAVSCGMSDKDIFIKWKQTEKELKLRTALATFPFPLARVPLLPVVRPINYTALKMEEECERYGIKFKNEFHDAFIRLAE